MSIYYVSNDGSDTNDGLSEKTPFSTIKKVNETLNGGDTVLFRRGDTFFGGLRLQDGTDMRHKTSVSAFGAGKKPVISQYKKAKVSSFFRYDEKIFALDLSDSGNYTGNVFDMDCAVGFIKVSGRIYYRNRKSLGDLEKEWDFYCDGRCIYILLEKHPSEYSSEIFFACDIKMIAPRHNMEICDITFLGTGGHGFQGVTSNTVIRNCDFCEIGGSFMRDEHGNPTQTRYGNGVECWTGSRDVLVENCFFSDIYDVAMSVQGNRADVNWENIVFRNNTAVRCTQSFEIWTKTEKSGTGIVNCFFENNICIDSGYGWGYEARPDKAQACHLLMYHRECEFCDIHIRNNTFVNARNCIIFKTGGAKELPEDYRVYGNRIIEDARKPIVFRWNGTDENDYTDYENEFVENNEFLNQNIFDIEKESIL